MPERIWRAFFFAICLESVGGEACGIVDRLHQVGKVEGYDTCMEVRRQVCHISMILGLGGTGEIVCGRLKEWFRARFWICGQANVVWLYSGAKKKDMNSDELDSWSRIVHMHTRSS
jgi:hypothetical protein